MNSITVEEIQQFDQEAKGIFGNVDGIKTEVTKSEDDLKKILADLNALGCKLNEDRRNEAEKAYQRALNHLDELKRKLHQTSKVEKGFNLERTHREVVIIKPRMIHCVRSTYSFNWVNFQHLFDQIFK